MVEQKLTLLHEAVTGLTETGVSAGEAVVWQRLNADNGIHLTHEQAIADLARTLKRAEEYLMSQGSEFKPNVGF